MGRPRQRAGPTGSVSDQREALTVGGKGRANDVVAEFLDFWRLRILHSCVPAVSRVDR
ncbi:hypothetical protein HMPREF0724_12681 [Prescottella equi ATCC 33707]|uniref:Uncharacterized protein n=1 Tax=Prescottella equi ATCC 33707 TaxID=525370 RepID=E9T2A4_RHOHA|nr:hypothetical protein HMPREF0724_12681 [Prescottella equi ATCC 33707]